MGETPADATDRHVHIAVTQPSDRENRVTRLFRAPRERVYRLFTDPQTARYLWSHDPARVTLEEFDVKVGARFAISVREPDGSTTRFTGEFTEVVPPERIVNTFSVTALPGVVALETDTFEEEGPFTRLTVVWKFATREDRDKMAGPGFEDTMTETWDRMADLLAESVT